jgi:hypothetical protein
VPPPLVLGIVSVSVGMGNRRVGWLSCLSGVMSLTPCWLVWGVGASFIFGLGRIVLCFARLAVAGVGLLFMFLVCLSIVFAMRVMVAGIVFPTCPVCLLVVVVVGVILVLVIIPTGGLEGSSMVFDASVRFFGLFERLAAFFVTDCINLVTSNGSGTYGSLVTGLEGSAMVFDASVRFFGLFERLAAFCVTDFIDLDTSTGSGAYGGVVTGPVPVTVNKLRISPLILSRGSGVFFF